jgi:hypothetical protein
MHGSQQSTLQRKMLAAKLAHRLIDNPLFGLLPDKQADHSESAVRRQRKCQYQDYAVH